MKMPLQTEVYSGQVVEPGKCYIMAEGASLDMYPGNCDFTVFGAVDFGGAEIKESRLTCELRQLTVCTALSRGTAVWVHSVPVTVEIPASRHVPLEPLVEQQDPEIERFWYLARKVGLVPNPDAALPPEVELPEDVEDEDEEEFPLDEPEGESEDIPEPPLEPATYSSTEEDEPPGAGEETVVEETSAEELPSEPSTPEEPSQ